MFSIRLKPEEDGQLREIMMQLGASEKSEVIRQLIHERWLALQTGKTFLERRGGHPTYLLTGPRNLSSRSVRKKAVADHLAVRSRKRSK